MKVSSSKSPHYDCFVKGIHDVVTYRSANLSGGRSGLTLTG